MVPPEQDEPRRDGATRGAALAAWLPVLAAMAIMITGCLSTFLILQMDEFQPKVGDIVAFKPGLQDTEMGQMTIPATVVSAAGLSLMECSLDPNVMAENGGSLVVEGVQDRPSLQYRIHWAGSVTAKPTSDCETAGQRRRRFRCWRKGDRPLTNLVGRPYGCTARQSDRVTPCYSLRRRFSRL
jgi:hypothetical protein